MGKDGKEDDEWIKLVKPYAIYLAEYSGAERILIYFKQRNLSACRENSWPGLTEIFFCHACRSFSRAAEVNTYLW